MAASATRTRSCANCGRTFEKKVSPGRPSKYCSPSCGAALRRKPAPPPDPSLDDSVVEIGRQVRNQAGDLISDVDEETTSAHLLHKYSGLMRQFEDLEAALVRRGRARGESWEAMGDALSVSSHRLRKKWTAEALERWEKNRDARAAVATHTRGTSPRAALWPAGTAPGSAEAPPGPLPQPDAAANQLAIRISRLQRRSGQTMREIADYALISPSYLSKIAAGTRRPSWPVIERLAEAYRVDPGQLRPLWEASVRPEPDPPPPTTDPESAAARLNTVLRSLYLSTGRPDPWKRRDATAGALSVGTTARGLGDPRVPDRDTTGRLVLALNGDLSDTERLWPTATTRSR
ncbi:helix-turn-helix domain-containing protein [Streptomyces cinnabarinus]|uniref:Helix-turn-helix domain-containing protein n=1 Tax=Streptomyces cinnabarinus TaxID=67287 RepID=A0ABY7KKN8_9ACTN|nr:helix-turn-helix domain-containing protein [Streptomyces cinnabarinus]WAZ25111.1 helix-turn-helix domain-containing protein [Streptomyces cinnabarinus]